MKFVVVHYHLRPGGIRSIIESATPHLARIFGETLEEIILAVGEGAEAGWWDRFRRRLGGLNAEMRIEPSFSYLSEQKGSPTEISGRIRKALTQLFAGAAASDYVVWTHNVGIGRNLLLARELFKFCAPRKIRIVAHHHDWWFENRWSRWPEMRRCGFPTLTAIAQTIFASQANVRHAGINQSDAAVLQRYFPGRSGWLPNLTERKGPPPARRVRAARAWLKRKCEIGTAPLWIVPCRLLRRKNVAEALLLTRWLRPEAWLVTTGAASSADEMEYARRLDQAAQRHEWRLSLGILHGRDPRKPSVAELLAASEAVLLTSLQEGFGLPYLEAAAAGRPLIARALPNIAPDLDRFGFRLPQSYRELFIDHRLFDWAAERERQIAMFRDWRRQLPRGCRRWVCEPDRLNPDRLPSPVPFSRLTLTAQLQVLAQPMEHSWRLCSVLNPFLESWRQRAAAGHLRTTPWPRQAERWLSGRAYARRFGELLDQSDPAPPHPTSSNLAQKEFAQVKLGAEYLYPLLWATRS